MSAEVYMEKTVTINGRPVVKVCYGDDGHQRILRLPGSSIGDYFAALTFLEGLKK